MSHKSLTLSPLALLSGILLAGCGSPTSTPTAPDQGTSGGSTIGEPCTTTDPTCTSPTPSVQQGSCTSGEICLAATCNGQDTGFKNGYCSQPCGAIGGTCPDHYACVVSPTTGREDCFKDCTQDSDCRQSDDYSCQDPSGAGQKVCYPFGTPQGGTNGGMACVSQPATLAFAGFTTPNLIVPNETSDILDSEGNVDVDGNGHAAVSAIAVLSTGTTRMVVSSYDDPALGGSGFASAVQGFGTAFSPGFTSDPVVAFDRTTTPPRLYLVWLDIQGSPGAPGADKTMIAHSDGYGVAGSWSTPISISGGDGSSAFLDKPWLVARNRQVVVTYDEQGSGGAHIRVVRSADGGTTWQAPYDADSGGGFRNLATPVLDDAGDLFVTWYEESGIRVVAQPAGSASIARSATVSGSESPAFDDPSIAVTADGKTLWVAFANDDPPTGSDLYATVSHDQGATWSSPVKVNDDADPKAPLPCATHYHGFVVADATGRAHVIWYDNRYLRGNVMYAHSTSDTSFSANTVVNDLEFDFTTDRSAAIWLGDYLGLALDGKNLYAAWSDPRNGSYSRMYYAQRPLP